MENKEVEKVEEVKEEVKEETKVETKVEEDEIIFHDAGPQVEKVVPQGGMSKLAIIAFALVLISAPFSFIPVSNFILASLISLCSFAGFILSIVAVVQVKAKNQKGKIFGILGIVFSVLIFIASLIFGFMQIANMPEDEFDQMFICPYVTDCVKKDDETSSCIYLDEDDPVICDTDFLTDEQFAEEK